MPAGCRFAPRCPHAELTSAVSRRTSIEGRDDRHVRCCPLGELALAGSGGVTARLQRNDPDRRRLDVTFRAAAQSVRAVDDVSFAVRKGETFGIIGEFGSGKSTLGRAVVCLLPPSGGKVTHFGKDPFALTRRSCASTAARSRSSSRIPMRRSIRA